MPIAYRVVTTFLLKDLNLKNTYNLPLTVEDKTKRLFQRKLQIITLFLLTYASSCQRVIARKMSL
jgi:hypothetical protein